MNTTAETKTLYCWGVKRTATLVATRPSIEQNPATGQYAYSYCGRYTEDKTSATSRAKKAPVNADNLLGELEGL